MQKGINKKVSWVKLLAFSCLVFPAVGAIDVAVATSVATKVKHEPISYFIPAHRIQLEAEVTDRANITLVRCYFKADEAADFVFVPMERIDDSLYQATLPAPAPYTQKIDYLFLVVNDINQVVKTQTFPVNKGGEVEKFPGWQMSGSEGELTVYTELPEAPKAIPGFIDSVTVDAVESGARFGVVAGIYSLSTGEATGAAAATTSAGSITATAGISTTLVVAAAAGVAAGAGAIAVAAGGGGGGGNGSEAAVNPNASIAWGDRDIPPDDAFQAVFDNRDLGVSSTGEGSGIRTITGLRIGTFQLRLTAISTADQIGTYVINLGGGARFEDDGSTTRQGTLAQGQSAIFRVVVPETGSARIQW